VGLLQLTMSGRRVRHHRVGRRRHRRMHGGGFLSFLGKANDFLKNSKLVSTVGSALGSAGVPFASQIGSVAGSLGYGRRRHRRGGALRLAGMGLGLAGRRRRHR